ncbi:MAG TPA: hypothetical protein VGR21_00510, partial [Cryptosporangiaceae bacterium]|nr:hypothetical protein [Cryptosporangiaceae bacterium]
SDAGAEELAVARAALRSGKVLVNDARFMVAGKVTVRVTTRSENLANQSGSSVVEKDRALPAVVLGGLPRSDDGTLIVPSGLARELGLTAEPVAVAASTRRMPTVAEEDAVNATVQEQGLGSYVQIERGFTHQSDPSLLIAVLAAGLVTLGGAGIATGLAAADGRADLRTLAAVGATPRLRRRIAMSQSGVIAVLGAGIGSIAGTVSGITVVFALDPDQAWHAPIRYLLDAVAVPWLALGLVLVVVPAVAMVGAGVLTRSRLPSELRRAT